MIQNDSLQSKTIAFLRFPLSVGVVLIHACLGGLTISSGVLVEEGAYPVYETLSYLISQILASTAVPLFFFFSGYLFFCKEQDFSMSDYAGKMKKRARTVLVPYLIWNLVVIAFFFCAQTFLPGLTSGKGKLIVEYDLGDWITAFWNSHGEGFGGMPINYPLWFIRDLMVVMALSPLVYWLVKKFRQYAVLLFGLLWICNFWFNVTGISITAVFFFSAGSYFGIHKKSFVDIAKPRIVCLTIVYAVFVLVEMIFKDASWIGYWHNVGLLAGMAFFIALTAHFIEMGRWSPSAFLAGSSFFIYAFHGLPLTFVMKALCAIIKPHSDIMVTVFYLLCPAITIAVGLGIYWLLKRYLPKFTAVITGGR